MKVYLVRIEATIRWLRGEEDYRVCNVVQLADPANRASTQHALCGASLPILVRDSTERCDRLDLS